MLSDSPSVRAMRLQSSTPMRMNAATRSSGVSCPGVGCGNVFSGSRRLLRRSTKRG